MTLTDAIADTVSTLSHEVVGAADDLRKRATHAGRAAASAVQPRKRGMSNWWKLLIVLGVVGVAAAIFSGRGMAKGTATDPTI